MNPAYKIHDERSAPEKALPLLEATKARLRFIPNLLGGLAEAPQVAEAFMGLTKLSHALSLTSQEREVAVIIISKENGCDYCVANHSMIAEQMKVDIGLMNAIKMGAPLENPKLEALRHFILEAMKERGHVSEATQAEFFRLGFTKAQALEIMLLIGIYTISNFSNGLMQVPVDKVFEPYLGLREPG